MNWANYVSFQERFDDCGYTSMERNSPPNNGSLAVLLEHLSTWLFHFKEILWYVCIFLWIFTTHLFIQFMCQYVIDITKLCDQCGSSLVKLHEHKYFLKFFTVCCNWICVSTQVYLLFFETHLGVVWKRFLFWGVCIIHRKLFSPFPWQHKVFNYTSIF